MRSPAAAIVRTVPFHGHTYVVDTLSPWLIHLQGGFGIRWYGVSYLLGILAGSFILRRWSRQNRIPLTEDDLSSLLLYAAIGILLGGRLGYCLFYSLDEMRRHPSLVLAIWQGGMASHGGILGLVIAVWLFARSRRCACWDAVAATGFLGVAFGRIANFINGELWGRPSTVPWAVMFPLAPPVGGMPVPRHPSQLYAAVLEGLVVFRGRAVELSAVCRSSGRHRCGCLHRVWRCTIYRRVLARARSGTAPLLGWMSKGQLLTLPMIALGAVALFAFQWRGTQGVREG